MAARPISDYPELQNVLEANEKIVYLCGAGASMSLGRHGNSWGAWLNAGRGHLSPFQQAAYDSFARSSGAQDLIAAASYLFENLKAVGSYTAFMDETIGSLHPVDPVFMEALQKMCRAGDLIATTNYDQLIEEATGSSYITYEDPGRILSIINGMAANQIIHLHGAYNKKTGVDNIIADTEQYRTILENAGAQFIQNLLSTHPLIIVGCGGTVSDPNLSGLIQFVIDKLKLPVPYFYLIKDGDPLPPLPTNAIPICYGSEYRDLPSFLNELSSYRLRNREEIKSLIQIDPYSEPTRLSSAFGRMHFANRFSPFAGRQLEQEQLNRFLHADGSILWWGVLGEGGIGKSRLLLEWLQTLPANWYGFFAKKEPKRFENFIPFTDTVIVLDYILGEEMRSAQTIAALMRQFANSSYRLRLLLVERRQDNDTEDWLTKVNDSLSMEERLSFESYRYLNGAVSADTAKLMCLEAFNEEDELHYIKNYLKAYVPIFLTEADGAAYLADLDGVGKTIQASYRDAMEEIFRRPLYLSIFTEVWVNKAGAIEIKGAKQLLQVYLKKEVDRWKSLLKEDRLVNSYLKLLAVACAIKLFNITDTQGNNYLQEDCRSLSTFLDEQDSYPGKQSVFDDLFVEQDELEEYTPEDGLLLKGFTQLTQGQTSDGDSPQGDDPSESETMVPDEAFALMAPYIKLEADPEEFYLQMLDRAGGLSAEEAQRLAELREKRIREEEALPDHAWIIVPAFPDIIGEFLVLYVLKERDTVPFTKLARANSVFEFGQFLTRAIEDWPDEPMFQQMLVSPPENVIEYFEFYLPWLISARKIPDFTPLENIMLQGRATLLFARYEMELWFRISIILEERGDWDRLLDSGKRFIQYISEAYDHPKVRERAAEVLNIYCIGLHNGAEAEKLALFLEQCDGFAKAHQDEPQLALICCDNRAKLIHLRRYLKQTAPIEQDWNVVIGYLSRYPREEPICLSAVEAANEYYKWLRQEQEDIHLQVKKLAAVLDRMFKAHPILPVAELFAVVTANLYMDDLDRTQNHSEKPFQKVCSLFNRFPESQRIRSAYASICGKMYIVKETRTRDVPTKMMNQLKTWSAQYPDEIEFQEAYFDVMTYHLEYAHTHGLQSETVCSLHTLEQIARRANYEEYGEENVLLRRVELLQALFGQ